MCGIAGILLAPHATDPRRLADITAMMSHLRHRGPDGDGVWIDEDAGIALGHRRLAIVDLSAAGYQPMASHDGGLIVTYNGEVYNFAELRAELAAQGHRFRGTSDTEVMLAAFESLGVVPALERFAGMFAVGLWDRRGRVLHLIRDRLGKKPLYLTLLNGALVFASELKAIHTLPGFRRSLDPTAVELMLRNGWVPEHHCIWRGVLKLPPGGMLSVRADELAAATDDNWLRSRIRTWWSLSDVVTRNRQNPVDGSGAEIEDELDRLLRVAVRQRMVADVPLGALLSGGIDSSLVVALMQAQSARPIRTFTIGFSEQGYDEAGDAAGVARHLGTEHTELRLTPAEAQAAIPELPRIWDEPFADESQLPTFLVSKLARRHVTVALSGDGGDEGFGGYTRHLAAGRLAPLLALPPRVRRGGAAALLALSADAEAGLLRRWLPLAWRGHLGSEHIRKLAGFLGATDSRELYGRLVAVSEAPALLDPSAAATDLPEAVVVPPILDGTSRLMFRDMAQYLPADILTKIDRAGMAVGLEARCPLLDHRVIDFAWRLPVSAKIRRGKGKWPLRRVLGRYLPNALFERPKHGFDVPIGAWLRAPMRDWAEALLAPARLADGGVFNSFRVQTLWQEHLSGRRDRAGELWAILMLQAWLDGEHGLNPPIDRERGMAVAPNIGVRRAGADAILTELRHA